MKGKTELNEECRNNQLLWVASFSYVSLYKKYEKI